MSDILRREAAGPPLAPRAAQMSGSCCSIVILNYNKGALLKRSLEALRDAPALPYQVEAIVVDNGSTDGSAEMVRRDFPWARLIANSQNVGSARGRNIGLSAVSGEFVLLLDDDSTIFPQQLDQLLEIARARPDAGIVTAMKVDAGGTPLYEYHVPSPHTLGLGFFLVNELSLIEMARAARRFLRLGDPVPRDLPPIVEIPYVGAGVMLVRRRAIHEVGPMDENIFFYGEDFDWCFRFRQRGWKILYAPRIRVLAGFGINAVRTKRASLIALQSRRYLFAKHVGRSYLPIYMAIATAGLLPKLAYYLVRGLRGRIPQDVSTREWLRRALLCIFGRESHPRAPLVPGEGHVP